jgi:hypothetical protein
MPTGIRNATLGGLLAGALAVAWAQGGGIYTCVDGKGRRLTSDRPIAECADREQRVLGSSGAVRATLGPSLSPVEQAAQAERDKKAAEEKLRLAEARRIERLLAARYPNLAAHDAERAKALMAVQDAIQTGQRRSQELRDQRKQLVTETEFYQGNPARYPLALKRKLEDNDQQQEAQQRLIANQEEEKQRVNQRFDQELAKLRVLWAQAQGVPSAEAERPIRR